MLPRPQRYAKRGGRGTRKISEIETAIDALEHEKSHKVHFRGTD